MEKLSYLSKKIILKSLICVGIMGILVSLYVQYGKPYLNEITLEKQDRARIEDLNNLDRILKVISATSNSKPNGESNIIYVSLPSEDSTCANIELPSLPADWSYRCVTQEILRNTDGTGWIPINFSQIAPNAIEALPVDPINIGTAFNYYEYVQEFTATTTKYALMAKRGAIRDASIKAVPGTPLIMSNSSNEDLATRANGIAMYLPLTNDGDDSVISNLAGTKEKIDLPQSNLYSNENCFLESCLLNSLNTTVTIPFPTPLQQIDDEKFSYSLFFKSVTTPINNFQLFDPGAERLDTNFESNSGSLFVWLVGDDARSYLVYKSFPRQYLDGRWHMLFVVKNEADIRVFIDGQRVGKLTVPTAGINQILNMGSITLNQGFAVNAITIYAKVFDETSVQAFFQTMARIDS